MRRQIQIIGVAALAAGALVICGAAMAGQDATPAAVPAAVPVAAAAAPAPASTATPASTSSPTASSAATSTGASNSSAAPAPAKSLAAPAVREREAMLAEGERRFSTNCGRCHQSPHHFPPRMMATVVRHMRVRATITDEDMRSILLYLTQ
ncbi:MAG TPA: hypothetical protein VLW83_01525 [Candidatus Acidoferrales bacterium]|nr:hypothetical protein [Candidatus Acidoferrales bacterium]